MCTKTYTERNLKVGQTAVGIEGGARFERDGSRRRLEREAEHEAEPEGKEDVQEKGRGSVRLEREGPRTGPCSGKWGSPHGAGTETTPTPQKKKWSDEMCVNIRSR